MKIETRRDKLEEKCFGIAGLCIRRRMLHAR